MKCAGKTQTSGLGCSSVAENLSAVLGPEFDAENGQTNKQKEKKTFNNNNNNKIPICLVRLLGNKTIDVCDSYS